MEPGASQLANLAILAVDDHAINREFLQSALRSRCREVVLAGSGREALAQARERDFDLVLMDLHMPDMDGLTTWQQIRGELSGRPVPRIIAVTADYRDEERRRLLDAGFDGFLNKPVSLATLIDAIDRVLRGEPDITPDAGRGGSRRLLDDERALAAASGNRELVGRLRGLLAEDLQRQMPELDAYLAGGHHDAAAEILHQWAGGCGYAGATRLEEACRAMQACLDNQLASSPGTLYVNLVNLADCTRQAIRNQPDP